MLRSRHLTHRQLLANTIAQRTAMTHHAAAARDPYTAKASSDDASLKTKLEELNTITKAAKFAMLTTKTSAGHMHSRAMGPCSTQGLIYTFIGNKESGKYDDISRQGGEEVNVSFSDGVTTHWASIAGKAKIITDVEKIKPMYSADVRAWLGDLGDKVHTGNYDDPRCALIEVIPTEIRYWYQTKGLVGMAFEVARGVVTGEVAAPGVLRTINAEELEIIRKFDGKLPDEKA